MKIAIFLRVIAYKFSNCDEAKSRVISLGLRGFSPHSLAISRTIGGISIYTIFQTNNKHETRLQPSLGPGQDIYRHTLLNKPKVSTNSEEHLIVQVSSKFLNVYDFGMKIYTSQPITAQLFFQEELWLVESCTYSCQNSQSPGKISQLP